jgi:endothelin-converting enzyme/putative endopeptidase
LEGTAVSLRVALLSFNVCAAIAFAQQSATRSDNPAAVPPATQMYVEPTLAYTPSLDVSAMDRSADACVDFYQYSCGGWQKNNPIPPTRHRGAFTASSTKTI